MHMPGLPPTLLCVLKYRHADLNFLLEYLLLVFENRNSESDIAVFSKVCKTLCSGFGPGN